MKDWTGNTVAYSKTLGASNHTSHEREKDDYYATEPKAVALLFGVERFEGDIWECACGEGHLSKEMERLGAVVQSTDLIDRGFGQVLNFLTFEGGGVNKHIITNPPYKYANEFILKALSILEVGKKLALFLPIRYLEGKARKKTFLAYPPQTIYVSSSRLKCAKNGDFENMHGSAMSYAWFVWQKGHKGETVVKWFN